MSVGRLKEFDQKMAMGHYLVLSSLMNGLRLGFRFRAEPGKRLDADSVGASSFAKNRTSGGNVLAGLTHPE
jgi:hypothetical protein